MKVKVTSAHIGRFGNIPEGEYDLDDKTNALVAEAYKEIPQIFEKAKTTTTKLPKA